MITTDRTEYFKKYVHAHRKERKEYMHKYRNGNPEYVQRESKRDRQHRIERKLKCFISYSNSTPPKCKCGFSDIRALTLDKIAGNHKEVIKLYGNDLYKFLIKNDYPEGWQVLCMNCQWIKRWENNEITQPHL